MSPPHLRKHWQQVWQKEIAGSSNSNIDLHLMLMPISKINWHHRKNNELVTLSIIWHTKDVFHPSEKKRITCTKSTIRLESIHHWQLLHYWDTPLHWQRTTQYRIYNISYIGCSRCASARDVPNFHHIEHSTRNAHTLARSIEHTEWIKKNCRQPIDFPCQISSNHMLGRLVYCHFFHRPQRFQFFFLAFSTFANPNWRGKTACRPVFMMAW